MKQHTKTLMLATVLAVGATTTSLAVTVNQEYPNGHPVDVQQRTLSASVQTAPTETPKQAAKRLAEENKTKSNPLIDSKYTKDRGPNHGPVMAMSGYPDLSNLGLTPGKEMYTKVRTTVGVNGYVTNVKVLQSSGNEEMDDRVVLAEYQSIFIPAYKDGKAVESSGVHGFRYIEPIVPGENGEVQVAPVATDTTSDTDETAAEEVDYRTSPKGYDISINHSVPSINTTK